MKLSGLKPLYNSMKANNIKRTKFSININNVIFEIIYFIDSKPHSLAIGVRERNLFFEIKVKHGFVINTYLGDKYATIYEILGLSSNGTTPLVHKNFMKRLTKEYQLQHQLIILQNQEKLLLTEMM